MKTFRILFLAALAVSSMWWMAASENPNFSGTWRLNLEKSDQGLGAGGPGGGPGGGGGGPVTLTVGQEGSDLQVEEAGGRRTTRFSVKIGAGVQEIENGTVEAIREGATLIIKLFTERETPRGSIKIEQAQVWSLSEDGKQLTRAVTSITPRGEMKRTTVFDLQE